MKKISIGNKNYTLISSYSEMDQKTLFKISHLRSQFLFEASQDEGYYALKIQVFSVLSTIPYRKLLGISSYEWADLLPHIDFVFTGAPDLTENKIYCLQIGKLFKQKFYASAGFMDKASLFEFCEADTAFINAGLEQNIDELYKLAAIIYRPMRKDLEQFIKSDDWNGDVREEYNQQKAVERSLLFKKLPFYKIVAVFLNYWSFRERELLNNSDLKILFKESNIKIESLDIGWLKTMFNVAGKEFGTFDETKSRNWKLVLYSIAENMTFRENQEKALADQRAFDKLRNRS